MASHLCTSLPQWTLLGTWSAYGHSIWSKTSRRPDASTLGPALATSCWTCASQKLSCCLHLSRSLGSRVQGRLRFRKGSEVLRVGGQVVVPDLREVLAKLLNLLLLLVLTFLSFTPSPQPSSLLQHYHLKILMTIPTMMMTQTYLFLFLKVLIYL